ncbi:DUF4129 domain-containing protein [Halobacteriales archaeon Cl-PHB]
MSDAGEDGSDTVGRRLLLVGVAALAVLALAAGAAALDDVRLSATGGTGGPESTFTPSSDAGGEPVTQPLQSDDASLSPWYLLAVYVLSVGAALLVGWQRGVRRVYLLMAGILAVMMVVALLFGQTPSTEIAGTNNSGTPVPQNGTAVVGAGGGSTPGEAPPANAVPTAVLVFVGLVLGMVTILGFSRRGPDESGAAEGEAAAGATDTVAEVGEAAGRAADELEATDLENAIYRAWHDMTDALDVPATATTTPAAFRDAAIDAGLPEAPVADLTTLFREVRYGDAPTTAERAERARTALRDIEAAAPDLAAEETTESSAADTPEVEEQ